MALSNNLSSIKGIHVSPGIYAQETVLEYAVKSLGITTLGAVGETVKGPAFQRMHIENWNEYKSMFGGTDPSKFRGSKYPKYELPYIAKQYLTESKQLEVVRVLGLSGYNAGPAWIVTASKSNDNSGKKLPVVILRSRGYYSKYPGAQADCVCSTSAYDRLNYYVGEREDAISTSGNCISRQYNVNAVALGEYKNLNSDYKCKDNEYSGISGAGFSINATNLGRFNIYVLTGQTDSEASESNTACTVYSVSLNPGDKDYILKVLGTTPDDGDAYLYVESIFDVALKEFIAGGYDQLNQELTAFMPKHLSEVVKYDSVNGIVGENGVPVDSKDLSRKDYGKRFIVTKDSGATVKDSGTTVVISSPIIANVTMTKDREYEYTLAYSRNGDKQELSKDAIVFYPAENIYCYGDGENLEKLTLDLNNYQSAYRYASTPWIVSNIMGDGLHPHMEKLFRLHTISDGNAANQEVKVSIENIRPDEGLFDVLIHDINDTDEYPVILERYVKCSMMPGTSNFIGHKIGSYDGTYEVKSKYVTVEVNDTLGAKASVPAGFLGYPTINFDGKTIGTTANATNLVNIPISYNKNFYPDVKNRKQYFGLSSRVGIDPDMFTFKGNTAYYDNQLFMTEGFHLDSRLSFTGTSTITVGDAEYDFECVSPGAVTSQLTDPPIIASEGEMENTIYSNLNLRKFVVYFAGGFDGWDPYREQRSNTDEFKITKYAGSINTETGMGYNFSRITNAEEIGLNQNGITSDFYAYLAGARQFANPEDVDCNVFVTPGIDLINNKELSQEVIEMLEEERADSIYVATTPDKPMGADDYTDEMYAPDEVVALLEDTDIDSNYTCTYYPWVKYYDQDNAQYIYLPVTKDVVTNMAATDNYSYPWFAPAGMNRGDVNCVRAHIVTKIADEDALYDGRINPVKTFAQDGVKIWGQKTLQVADNQLNRIATRRLLLRMRKLIAIGCRQLIFEPNDPTAKQQFLSIVTPIMDNIRANRGISDYRIEVLDSVESRERYELPARIYFKPYSQIEYVLLDFVLTPEGISFDNI